MTKEELLQPRYKVIADYPQPAPDDCHKLLIGDILYLQKVNNGKQDIMTYMRHGRCGHMSVGVPCIGKPEKYPAVFRKLEWWQIRKSEEMPSYISYISLTRKEKIYGYAETSDDNFYKARLFVKVETWKLNKGNEWFYNENPFNTLCPSHLPANAEEYEAQQTTK